MGDFTFATSVMETVSPYWAVAIVVVVRLRACGVGGVPSVRRVVLSVRSGTVTNEIVSKPGEKDPCSAYVSLAYTNSARRFSRRPF
jgi:hypothetical protein